MIVLILALSVLLGTANVAFADDIVLEHDFTTNPTSDGWTLGDSYVFGFKWESGDGWVHNRFNQTAPEEAYLISPSFSTAGATEGTVSFYYQKNFSSTETPLHTNLNLEYRLGGSGSWERFWTSNDDRVVPWETKTIGIPEGMLGNTDVQLRWYALGEGVPGEPPFGMPVRIIGDFWLDDIVVTIVAPLPTNTPTEVPTDTPTEVPTDTPTAPPGSPTETPVSPPIPTTSPLGVTLALLAISILIALPMVRKAS